MSKKTRLGGTGGGGKRGGGGGRPPGSAPTGVAKRAVRGAAAADSAVPPALGAPSTRRRGSGLAQAVTDHPSLFNLPDPEAALRSARATATAARNRRPAPASRKPTAKKPKKGSRTTRKASATPAARSTPAAPAQPQPSDDPEEDEQDAGADPALGEAATVAGDDPVANDDSAAREEQEAAEREAAEQEVAERETAEMLRLATEVADIAKKAKAEKEKVENEEMERVKKGKAEKEKAGRESAKKEAVAREEAARKKAEEKAAHENAEKDRKEKEYQDWLREQSARENEEFRRLEALEKEERIRNLKQQEKKREQEALEEMERTKGYKKAGAGVKRAAESAPETQDASKKSRVESDTNATCDDKDSCKKFKNDMRLAGFKFDRNASTPTVKMNQPLSLDTMFQGLAAITEAINESRATQSQSKLFGLFHPRSLVDPSMLNHPATPMLHDALVPIERKAMGKTHYSLIVLVQTRAKSEDESEFFEMHHYDSDPKMRAAFNSTLTGKSVVKRSVIKAGWAGRADVKKDSVLGETKTRVVCDRPNGREWAVGIHIILNGWVCALHLKHNPNALVGKVGFYEQAVNLINYAIWGFVSSQMILDFFDCYETFKDSKDFSDYGKLDRHIGKLTGRIPDRSTARPKLQQAGQASQQKPGPKTPTSAKPAAVFPEGLFGDILGDMDTSASYAAADAAAKPKPTGQGPTMSKADQKILDDAAAGRVNDKNQDEDRNERRKAKAKVRAKKAKVVDNDPDAAEVADLVQEYPDSACSSSNTDDEYMNDAEDDEDAAPPKPAIEAPPELEKASKWALHNRAVAEKEALQKQQPQPAQAREASVELEDPENEDLFDADVDFDADIEYEADGELENLFPGASVPSNSPPRPRPTSAPRPNLQPTVVDDPEGEEDLYSSGGPVPNQAQQPRKPSLALPPRSNPQAPPPTPYGPPTKQPAFPVFNIPQPALQHPKVTLTNPEGTTYPPRVSPSQLSPSAFVKGVVPPPIVVPNKSGTFAVPDTPSTSDESQKGAEQVEATEEDEELLQVPQAFEWEDEEAKDGE